ncbi:MAG: TIM-barrel domain-containing protein [Sedimentisphaerales bacterium]
MITLSKQFKFWVIAALLSVLSVCYAEQIGRAQLLGDGIARFYEPNVIVEDLPPSMSLEREPNIIGPVPAGWTPVPQFGIAGNGRYIAIIKIETGTSLYGTGEVSGPLLRNGCVTECWNTDAYGYDGLTGSLYQSHPWVLAVRKDGTAFGVLADTTWRCQIDLTKDIKFSAQGPSFPVIVIDADSPQNVLRKLTTLIGKMPLPPKWAIGYHQCRYSYYPDKRVREIATEFRNRNIPCDVIWLDIDYMNGFKIFTFNPNRFPDPAALNNDLHKMGFKTVWMIDPGVKAEKGYFVYNQGAAGDFFVQKANGREYHGRVWPGMCAFPDFTMPQTQNWWASLYKPFMAKGIDGIWNDMDEPSVFKTPLKTMPDDNIHRGGDGLPQGPHAQYHNIYGMLMVKASRQGIQQANPDKRPFVLTRANFIGGHRYAATWTGDNTSDWNHLKDSVSMILNLGLSGQPFCGPDIGGFAGNSTPELFARWMGVGALLPFARGHTEKHNKDKEPWAFGESVENTCRTALQRRYRLLPYLYTLFYEASVTGLPVARPVFFADPADPKLRKEDNAFLLGSDILVVPRLKPESNLIPNLPNGIWRSISLVGEDAANDTNQPELKIRGGAIISLGRVVQNTEQSSLDPLTLLVCLDENGRAKGTLYEDAGDGYGYLSGEYLLTNYIAKCVGNKVIVEIASRQGKMPRPERAIKIEFITEKKVINIKGDKTERFIFDM